MLYPFIGPIAAEDVLNGNGITPGISGCYVIRNNQSGKTYVGQSTDIVKRIKAHLTGRGGHPDVYFDYRTTCGHDCGCDFSVWYEQTPFGWNLIAQTDASGVIQPDEESEALFLNQYSCGFVCV